MTQSKLITVPIKAKSSKAHPEVHLAYITDKEQDLLIKKDLYKGIFFILAESFFTAIDTAKIAADSIRPSQT